MLEPNRWGAIMRCLFIAALFALAACSGDRDEEPAPEPLANVAPAKAVEPPPNYDEKEGDTYLYITAVSEEDRKVGRSAGDVVMFSYLGEAGGVYRLARINDDGRRLNVSECIRQCKVIKVVWEDGTIRRLGFDPGSVIGSAFEDAFNGHLQLTTKVSAAESDRRDNARSAEESAVAIPAAFVGEWNSDQSACGTGLSDSRLRIEPRRLRFYESDGEVNRVTIKNGRSVTVEASFSGEGQTWKDSVEMILSRSGSELTIDDFTRQRCP